MLFIQATLAYNAFILILFGLIGLIFPKKMIESMNIKFPAENDIKECEIGTAHKLDDTELNKENLDVKKEETIKYIEPTERQFMIYRITGLWVVVQGIICVYVAYALNLKVQRIACILYTLTHLVECIVKKKGASDISIFPNLHMVIILIAALGFSF